MDQSTIIYRRRVPAKLLCITKRIDGFYLQFLFFRLFPVFDNTGGIARDYGVRWDVFRYNRTGSDNCTMPDRNPRQYGHTPTDPDIVSDDNGPLFAHALQAHGTIYVGKDMVFSIDHTPGTHHHIVSNDCFSMNVCLDTDAGIIPNFNPRGDIGLAFNINILATFRNKLPHEEPAQVFPTQPDRGKRVWKITGKILIEKLANSLFQPLKRIFHHTSLITVLDLEWAFCRYCDKSPVPVPCGSENSSCGRR